jgi:hypothetical protein
MVANHVSTGLKSEERAVMFFYLFAIFLYKKRILEREGGGNYEHFFVEILFCGKIDVFSIILLR